MDVVVCCSESEVVVVVVVLVQDWMADTEGSANDVKESKVCLI